MVRALVLLSAVSSPAWAIPSFIGGDDLGTHGLHLLAQAPPSSEVEDDAPRAQLMGQLQLAERRLGQLPSRGGPLAMTIAGFAGGGLVLIIDVVLAATFMFAAVGGGSDAILGTAALVCGLVGGAGLLLIGLGIAGAVLLGQVNSRRGREKLHLEEEIRSLRNRLKALDAAPPPPPYPGVLWQQPRMFELASF